MLRSHLRLRALVSGLVSLTGNSFLKFRKQNALRVRSHASMRSHSRRALRAILLENLESRQLMAFAPLANDDVAFYTSTNTDLTVTTYSSPAYLLANDLERV